MKRGMPQNVTDEKKSILQVLSNALSAILRKDLAICINKNCVVNYLNFNDSIVGY